tara:strand:+ start:1353 stop:1664 length:312 start_codon:yes stop_codon:yes gene_type:complete
MFNKAMSKVPKVTTIMANRYVMEDEGYNKDLLLFIKECQTRNVPFVLNYRKKDGRKLNIYCDKMNWLQKINYIYNYDIENELRSLYIFENILDWMEAKFNERL